MLAELNEDLFPYPWSPDEEFIILEDNDTVAISLGFYTGPPSSTPEYLALEIPPANVLVQRIITSSDKLFFISHPIGSRDIREWRLVRVAFEDTMSLYSSCVLDGHYLVDFYLPHPSNAHYNAINKRFWLQYHSQDDIVGPTSSAHTHYIRPSDTSKAYAKQHCLLPYQKYLRTSLTLIPSFKDRLSSLPFMVTKAAIVFLKLLGTP